MLNKRKFISEASGINDIVYFLKQIRRYTGKMLFFNVLFMMGIGLLDGASVLLLIPLISISGIIDLEIGTRTLTNVFNIFQLMPASLSLLLVLALYICIATVQNVLQRHLTLKNTVIQQRFLRHVQIETYQALLEAKWKFFMKKRSSDLIHVLHTEVTKMQAGMDATLKLMASVIITLFQVMLAFLLSPVITSFVIVCGILLIFINRTFLKSSLQLGSKNYELAKDFHAGITEQINGMKDIKSNQLEQYKMNWFLSITKETQAERIKVMHIRTTSQMYYKVALSIFMAIFMFVAIVQFSAHLAQLTIIIIIFSRLWPRVLGIQSSMEKIAATIPSFKVVRQLQGELCVAREFPQPTTGVETIRMDSEIELRNVSFRYQEEVVALHHINLRIPANKITAIVGKSGAGKSTLIDLLMGLHQPETGEIVVDGVVLTPDRHNLRGSLSYVAQEPYLFHTTIRENLLLGSSSVGDDELWRALSFASAVEFVKKLPKGLETVIGDRGVKLSGGERQRIVLARAILRNPSILLLDEATSALDTENEQHIQHAIRALKGKLTVIIIAHRLSTISDADHVIVLDKGEVMQQGTYEQLSTNRGVFHRMLVEQDIGLVERT